MRPNPRYSGASIVPLFPDRTKNGETASPPRFTREGVLGYCRCHQLKAEASGHLSVALRMVRLQAMSGAARLRVLRDLRRLQLKAEARGQWATALRAIELQWRFVGPRVETAPVDAPRLAA